MENCVSRIHDVEEIRLLRKDDWSLVTEVYINTGLAHAGPVGIKPTTLHVFAQGEHPYMLIVVFRDCH